MSFSSNGKQELCRLPINRKMEAAAELYGILLYCNAFTSELVRITTESRDLAERLPRLMQKVFGFSFDQEPEEGAGKLLFVMESQEKIHKMFAQFGLSAARDVTLHVNYGMLEEDEERLAFLRGAFLSGGSVTDPAKRYHLELTTSHYKVSRETCALLLDAGFSPKETARGGNSILYFKQSDMIEDFLTAIGAPVCAMGVMEAKVEKDLRNGVNRRVNCETANLTKVVDASMEQVAAIKKLQKQGRLKELPPKLRETAKLRLENPEATLQELAAMQTPPVSKSAMMDRVQELGQSAIALTDHGVMYGTIDFYRAAKKAGIKPIIGCEVYVARRTRLDKVYGVDKEPYHLVLLCENETGYRNLSYMVSLGFTEGFYNRPRVDMELLREHHEGLIALSACLAGRIPQAIMQDDLKEAERAAREYAEIFGPEHFYLELQDHGIPEQRTVNGHIRKLAEKLNLPLVVTNDAHYLRKADAKMQDVLLCIQTGKTVDDPNRMKFETEEFYLKSEQELRSLFPDVPEAFENTVRIAERCNVEFTFGKYFLPEFKLPEGVTSLSYLRQLCQEGFDELYGTAHPEYMQQLEYEIDMIEKLGFTDYFLIVWDFVRFATSAGIPVGTGPGSAAAYPRDRPHEIWPLF